MIEVENLSKRHGDRLAVDAVSLVVQPGKSTSMRMIAGLDVPTAGRVALSERRYVSTPAPMAEPGVLLEARAVHTGRSARNHLLALAQANGEVGMSLR